MEPERNGPLLVSHTAAEGRDALWLSPSLLGGITAEKLWLVGTVFFAQPRGRGDGVKVKPYL